MSLNPKDSFSLNLHHTAVNAEDDNLRGAGVGDSRRGAGVGDFFLGGVGVSLGGIGDTLRGLLGDDSSDVKLLYTWRGFTSAPAPPSSTPQVHISVGYQTGNL